MEAVFLMRSFFQSGREINHSDRFFIGGQHNLRGFGNNGYGPRDVGCALGGTSMMQLGLHFYSSLDFLSQVTKGFLKNLISPQVALHAFGVAGNVNSPQNILKGTRLFIFIYHFRIKNQKFRFFWLCDELWRGRCDRDRAGVKFRNQLGPNVTE